MDNLVGLLDEYSCVIKTRNGIEKYTEKGIIPLILSIRKGGFADAEIADRVIGRAAALLMVYGGVRKVYTRVISLYAAEVFKIYGIECIADERVDYIANRTGDGMCPMEQLCLNVTDAAKAYEILKNAVHI